MLLQHSHATGYCKQNAVFLKDFAILINEDFPLKWWKDNQKFGYEDLTNERM